MKSSPLRTAAVAAGSIALVAVGLAPAAAYDNPILDDGSYYSADPATLVVDDTLYIFAGRDEAGPTTNDFIMNEWQAFSTTDVASEDWEHHPALMRPEEVFDWATPGRAYAGQVVEGVDGRYYWYVPVHEADSASADPFGIGVAVSDSPLGPWEDHAGGPIISQEILGNTIHNIDPTVLVEDGRAYLYWGSFSQLRGIELDPDMKTLVGDPVSVTSLTGFFEGAWLFEREGTYYMAYAGNNAGPTSACTPANYHACIAYGTAPTALGPWTYQGTLLPPVSSTTSHPAITEFDGEWYLVYHTADAVGGNHFRRSVAIDDLEWDDSVTPARILPVTTTPPAGVDLTPRTNVAPWAQVSASNEPIPTQYWIRSLNDELVRPNPLPPDMWGSWTGDRPAQQWIRYDFAEPVRIDRTRIDFWRDVAPGTGNGVSDPAAWVLQYWESGAWHDVEGASGYPTSTTEMHTVTFDAVTTQRVRVLMDAAPGPGTPPQYSALAVEEWEVHAAPADGFVEPSVSTTAGVAPHLPATVALQYGEQTVDAPVRWNAVSAQDYAAAGAFTVVGMAEGYGASTVTAQVTVLDGDPYRDNVAPLATASASYTAGWNDVAGLNDDVQPTASGDVTPHDNLNVWGAWPQVADQWVQYDWDEPVLVDSLGAYFIANLDAEGVGIDVPAAWSAQVWDADADTWVDVTGASDYGTAVDVYNTVTFDPVVTTRMRLLLDAQGTAETRGSLGIKEWQVHGETADAVAPSVQIDLEGVDGADGWWVSDVDVTARGTDDRGDELDLAIAIDGGEPSTAAGVRELIATVSGDGEHQVSATATDAWGNVSPPAEQTLRIDTTSPSVSPNYDAEARTVDASGADGGSGLARIEASVDGGAWAELVSPVVLDAERHTVRLRAVDVAGNVSGTAVVEVPRDPDAPLEGNIAPLATPTASFTSGWNDVNAVNDESESGSSWGTWPQVGEQWVRLDWDREVTVDRAGVLFFADSPDDAGVGMIPPREWVLEGWDADTESWVAVLTDDAYARERDVFNEVSFEAVTTTALRVRMQAWGEEEAGGSAGILEIQAFAAERVVEEDVTAPVVTLATDPATPASGWHRGPVDVIASATDDVDAAPVVEQRVDGSWVTVSGAIEVDAEGETSVEVRARDAAGNVSPVESVTVAIDSTPPTLTGAFDELARQVTAAGTDAGSGLNRIELSLDGGAWDTLDGHWQAGAAAATVTLRAVDAAGNVSAAVEIAVPAAADPDPDQGLTGDEQIVIGGGELRPGSALEIELAGARAGAQYLMEFRSAPVELGSITVAADGTGSLSTVVPVDATPGTHHVVAILDGEEVAVEVTVLAADAGAGEGDLGAGAGAGGSGGELSATGASPVTGWLALAALLLAGWGCTLVARACVRR